MGNGRLTVRQLQNCVVQTISTSCKFTKQATWFPWISQRRRLQWSTPSSAAALQITLRQMASSFKRPGRVFFSGREALCRMSIAFEEFFFFVCGPHTVCDKVLLDDNFMAL